ncbi:hypothetical protein [Desertivirga xinjiangensis]|uniref:hypothetical protein n=1 Tax=Desertivirga xinjiangensis TaxID=539206 RepID=UPI00210C08E2|nr:hypothetical protein [Pedobacter xinjiangensis]
MKIGVVLVLAVMILFFPGCSVLKNRSVNKTDSSFVQREKLTSAMSLKERTDSEIRLIYADSGKHTFMVEISPEGDFTYSPVGGFSGKAKMLKISGNGEIWRGGRSTLSARNDIKIDSVRSEDMRSRLRISNSQTSVKTEKQGKWYVWLLVVTAVLIGLLILKKRLLA